MGAPQTPVIRMDKSMPFGEVHGERTPDDRHVNVHFFQDGLPFNAQGHLVMDHPDIERSPVLKKRVEMLLKKASKKKAAAPGDDAADPETSPGEGGDGDDGPVTVNLQSWAKGEERYEWQMVSDAIAARYKKRVATKTDAAEFLIDQRVVSLAELSPDLKKAMGV